jgi:hypothetical protein
MAVEYAVVTAEGMTDYEMRLELAIIRQMNRVCREQGARLIVLDIPKPDLPHTFLPSIPPALRTGIQNLGVDVIGSMDVLSGLNGVAEIHVAHGHRHISELTHSLFAIALGQRMLASPASIAQSE